jgi:hypothetical protein
MYILNNNYRNESEALLFFVARQRAAMTALGGHNGGYM